jgi:cytochrome c2
LRTGIWIAVAIAAATVPAAAHAAGDAARGRAVFQRCAACHSVAAGENGIGPSLHGIVASKAGTVPGYRFSKGMASSGIVWDDTALKKYLADPEAAVPGTKMRSGAVPDAQARDDLIVYLHEASK